MRDGNVGPLLAVHLLHDASVHVGCPVAAADELEVYAAGLGAIPGLGCFASAGVQDFDIGPLITVFDPQPAHCFMGFPVGAANRGIIRWANTGTGRSSWSRPS